jgi:hypothetical protein
MSDPTRTSSVTSANFIGFDDLARNGTAPIMFNQIYIAPDPPTSAGKWIHASAGFLPGQQSYLKQRRALWNKSRIADDLKLAGFRRMTYG